MRKRRSGPKFHVVLPGPRRVAALVDQAALPEFGEVEAAGGGNYR